LNSRNVKTTATQGYAPVNGLKMYYEVEGTGDPLVCIPPAFGYVGLKSFPALVQSHKVITVDLQGHGRTADIPERPLSIEQYAKDVVGLLKYLAMAKADLFGESYGGNTAATIAMRYDKLGSIQWQGFSKDELASIKAPFLIVLGDCDFVRLEHAVETVKLIPNAEPAVIPSASHFALFSEQERVIPIVKHFLEKPEKVIPLATAETGYHPGATR